MTPHPLADHDASLRSLGGIGSLDNRLEDSYWTLLSINANNSSREPSGRQLSSAATP